MLYYYRNILSKLTFQKVTNMLWLWISFHLSRLRGKPTQLGMPASVSMEPTTSCNLRCPQCPSGLRQFSRETGMLDPRLFEKTLLQLRDKLHSLTFYFQGEPYLNRQFLDMVRFASAQNVFTITSTNGHYMDESAAEATIRSGLDKLIISIDGLSQETYSRYRVGGQLDKVLEGTRRLVEKKKALRSRTPHIVWQFVAFSHNEHEVAQVKELGRKMGVNEVSIKTAQIYDYENGHAMIPGNQALSRYRLKADGSYAIDNRLLNHCWRMWQGCVITWDGKIVPCCFDKDAAYRLGNLQEQSFRQIWNSEAYNSFRAMVLRGRKEIEICRNCSEGTKVFAQ